MAKPCPDLFGRNVTWAGIIERLADSLALVEDGRRRLGTVCLLSCGVLHRLPIQHVKVSSMPPTVTVPPEVLQSMPMSVTPELHWYSNMLPSAVVAVTH